MNKTAIAAALLLISGAASAAPVASGGVFNMYSQKGLDTTPTDQNGPVNVDSSIAGFVDQIAGTWGVSSTALFFGLPWTASNGTLITTPGSYVLDVATGAVTTGTGPIAADGSIYFTINVGQIAGLIDFAYGGTTGIKVVDVWNINPDGSLSTVLVPGMENGPFPGFNAAFNLTGSGLASIINPVSATQGGVTTTLDGQAFLNNADISFTVALTAATIQTVSWSTGTDADVVSSIKAGATSATLTIDPSTANGPQLVGSYSVQANVTDTNSKTYTETITFNAIAGLLAGDYDGDNGGVDDNAAEGFDDSDDGDGIPNYLDHSGYPISQLQTAVTGDNTSSSVITSSIGIMGIGDTAVAKYSAAFTADQTTTAISPVVQTSDLLPADDTVASSCNGGCFDTRVISTSGSSFTDGDTVKITLPLTQAIPANPVFRVYSVSNKWDKFAYTATDSLKSAPALSSGPVVCPAIDNAAYTPGLTEGDFCIQVTTTDNSSNDSSSNIDGLITFSGGVGTTTQFSIEDTGEVDAVGGGWWFLMGLPTLLGFRRFTAKK